MAFPPPPQVPPVAARPAPVAKRPRRRLASLVVAAALGAGACSVITDLGDLTSGNGGGGAGGVAAGVTTTAASSGAGAGGDAGRDAAPDAAAAGCTLKHPPGRPGAHPGGELPPFVVAMRSIDLDESGAALGYDLDGLCSCKGTPPDGPDCLENVRHCDGPGGIDDSAQSVFKLLSAALNAIGSAPFSAAANSGLWTALLKVSGYNGLADDDQVTVAWYQSTGFVPVGSVPAWDGTDSWFVSVDSVVGSNLDAPVVQDTKAYVANHVLVASFANPELTFPSGMGIFRLRLTNAVTTATLAPEPGNPGAFAVSDGAIAGRWAEKDVFALISAYRDDKGKPLCTNSAQYQVGRMELCNAADMLVSGSPDPTTKCDAISTAVGFKGQPAKLGPLATRPAPTPGCPAGTDPSTDSCN